MKMPDILKSRKVRYVLADAFISILILVLSWVLVPDDLDKALLLIGILQPVVLMLIGGTAWEDAAMKRNPSFKPPPDIFS